MSQHIIYGVDLGTTFTKCAFVPQGGTTAEVIDLDVVDQRPTPLLRSVTLTTDKKRPVAYVGARSWDVLARWDPNKPSSPACRRFEETKLWIGENPDSLYGDRPPWEFEPHGFGYRPEDIGALTLRKVQSAIRARNLPPMERIVITHPQNFSEARREATRHAVRLAGLEVVDTITEPDAAILQFGIDQAPGLYMVFDIGGGTLDILLLRVRGVSEGGSEVVTSDGIHIGGRRWDEVIFNHVVKEYASYHQGAFIPDVHLDDRIRQEWLLKAERMKRDLCSLDSTEEPFRCQSEDFDAPGDTMIQLTRVDWEEQSEQLLLDCMNTADKVMRRVGDWSDIQGALLVGGSSRLPALQRAFGERGVKVAMDAHPDTVVARGAALHAHALQNKEQGGASAGRLLSILNHQGALARGLGILANGSSPGEKIVVNMVPKDSKLPYERTRKFKTTRANQAYLDLELWEGEDEDPELCVPVGKCSLQGFPLGPAGSPIHLKIELRANGEKILKIIVNSAELVAPILFDESRVLQAGALVERRAFLSTVEVR